MTNDKVHGDLVRWIASVTGLKAIRAHQSGKAPALPYIMVNFLGQAEVREHPQAIEYTGNDDDPVTAVLVIEVEWRFSVHAYGESPTDLLRPIVSAVKLPQAMESLLPSSVIHEISQIRNVPEYINSVWQPRAQMDVFVRGLIRDGHVIDVIEQVSAPMVKSH